MTIHYYDNCGGETGDGTDDGDVYAAEPWGLTCPACIQMVSNLGDPAVTVSLVIDERDNLISYRDSKAPTDLETIRLVDELIEKGRVQIFPSSGAAGAGAGEPDRGDDHI